MVHVSIIFYVYMVLRLTGGTLLHDVSLDRVSNEDFAPVLISRRGRPDLYRKYSSLYLLSFLSGDLTHSSSLTADIYGRGFHEARLGEENNADGALARSRQLEEKS